MFQRVAHAFLHLVNLFLATFQHIHLVVKIHLQSIGLALLALQFLLLLVDLYFALFKFGFTCLHLRQTRIGNFLGLTLDRETFFLAFYHFVVLEDFSLQPGLLQYGIGL